MASPRQSVLASRHKALGSSLGDWNDMDVAWTYDQDLDLENHAVRNTAGLFDVSGLKKIHVTGPDALAVLDHVCTRDLTKCVVGEAILALILNDDGILVDDCMIFFIMPNHYIFVHGSGIAPEQIEKSAEGKDVQILFDDDLHTVSLQGPKSTDFLNPHTSFDLTELKNSHNQPGTVFGRPCLMSRTGYANERGYEIFAKAEDTVVIWDAILEHGKDEGIIPASFDCIDVHRVEAGLYFFPFDMEPDDTPWDLNYDFAVDLKKEGDYRGKKSLLAAKGKETTSLWSVIVDADVAADEKDELYDGDKKIGYITGPAYSSEMKASIAIVRVDKEYAVPGKKLELKGANLNCSATTGTMPLYDPKKNR